MVARPRPVSPRQPTSLAARLVYPVLILMVVVFGFLIYGIIQGELRLPFGGGVLFAFGKDDEPKSTQPVVPAGTVAVFASPGPLPAFTKITRDHLMNAAGLHTVPVVEEMIEPNGLFRADAEGAGQLMGRVLKGAKLINRPYRESDFLPPGTRPGPSAGIPPGKRGVWIDVAQVPGLADMHAGDFVDFVAAETLQAAAPPSSALFSGVVDPVAKARMERLASSKSRGSEARSWVIARRAVVVAPRREREMAGGKPGQPAAIVEEVFVAMSPDEVTSFSQALALKVAIVAAPRSGQPETDTTEIQDVEPPDPNEDLRRLLLGGRDDAAVFGFVEVIRGGQRETVTVPRADENR